MIIWYAMLIPIVTSALAYKVWGKKFVWWEFILPIAASFLFILITKFSVEKSLLSDTEYRGGLIVEARYYEYWETWVEQTCSYTTTCCCDSKGENCKTETHYYDCSYCDHNRAYWKVYDDQGHSWGISEQEYLRLLKQWKATPEFVELNRSIRYHGSCGKDGDMYRIRWNGEILTSEASTWTTTYDNHVQVSRTNFDLPEVSKKDAKKYGLYEYPDVNGFYQRNILGLDSMNFLSQPYKNGAYKMFEFFNGNYGPKRKIRTYILLFNNKPIDVGIKQKNYWIGGNKNELVVCIGLDKNSGKLDWVYPFTWSENKRIAVDIREDVMNMDTLNFTNLYHILDDATKTFTYRDFNQYNYLSVDPPTWEVWFVYILTFLISCGLLFYGYQNEFESPDEPKNSLRDYRY